MTIPATATVAGPTMGAAVDRRTPKESLETAVALGEAEELVALLLPLVALGKEEEELAALG